MATNDGRDEPDPDVDVEAETRLGDDALPGSPTTGAGSDGEAEANAATRVGDGTPPAQSDDSVDVAEAPADATDTDSAKDSGADTDFDADAPTQLSAKRPISPSGAAPASDAAPAEPPLHPGGVAIGEVLFGEYEIIEVLGAGGMGEVYKAVHRRLDEPRAIKMMHADLSTKKGATEFFLREAKALLAVRHSAVVHCHDLLSDDKGRVYLIMELIEGIALSSRMKQGPLPTDEVIVLGARLASGLAAAHRCGVVHRDVSPDNVVLPDGDVARAKLIDFGIAKLLDEGQGTIVDGFKGKLSYASPEQLGFFGGQIDGRSDFYSLGLVLCAAALGRPIGMGTTVMEAVDARRHLSRLPDEIPIGLRSALEPLLELDPDDRPQRVEQLFVSPDRARALGDDSPDPAPARRRSAEPVASDPGGVLRWVSVAAGLALILGIGGYFLSGAGESQTGTSDPVAADSASTPIRRPEPVQPPSRDELVEKPAPEEPPKPPVHRVSALDKVRIVGLLRGADTALAENRLQSPKGDNAFEKYNEVLRIQPDNREAKRGLLNVATRYLELSETALRFEDVDKAKSYLSKASSIAPHHPRLAEVRNAVNGVGG